MKPVAGKRVLVVCNRIVVAGGLYRFERFGRAIKETGHELCFVAFDKNPERVRQSEFAVLDLEQAARERWDSVMLPGAGFPAKMVDRLGVFDDPRFGVRVQHILNDQTKKKAFLRANQTFKPHVIVSNNRHWSLDDLSIFTANRRHILEGAVDTDNFAGCEQKPFPAHGSSLCVGGQISHRKDPAPLLALARRIPELKVKLFGDPAALKADDKDLIDQGRLKLVGFLNDAGLADFYAGVDLVIHVESNAGWANLPAEAMAAGVPVICTPHGTLAFAEHERTAIVVNDPTPDILTNAVDRLRRTPGLAETLARAARARIRAFGWAAYSERLMSLID